MTNEAVYSFQVRGHLDDHWGGWFGGLTVTRNIDGTTTMTGSLTDQAELYGVLARLRDLGITLISLTSTPSPNVPTDKE